MKKRLSLILITIVFAIQGFSMVKLPALFSDNMVLQQQTKAAVWGWAEVGKTITITTSWNGKKYKGTVTKEGTFKILVATPSYGGPYDLTISDGDILTLSNILIGDVWICSGQSNMEMPLAGWGKIDNYQEEIAAANYPNIRLLQVNHQARKLPADDVVVTNNGWTSCNPTTVAPFSATAYFYAREIYKKTGIPIGLIHSSWGGTVVEAWMSPITIKLNADFAAQAEMIAQSGLKEIGFTEAQNVEKYNALVLSKDLGYKDGKFEFASKTFDDSQWGKIKMPSLWENSVLPNFDGVVYLKKTITIPMTWTGRAIKIGLGGIDDQDVTYFDGEKIGEGKVANAIRTYQIPAEKVTPGEHTITIRVFDIGGGGGISGDPKLMYLMEGQDQISLAGDWKYQVGLNYNEVGPSPELSSNVNRPTVLYNGMINPLIQFAIKGVIWYQGESNAGRANQYRTLFPSLIKDWRKRWNIGDFPFYFVQLANFKEAQANPVESDWAELRDAQKETLGLPNTGMAVTIDIGNAKDIHPKNKQDVGKRLAFISLAKTYKQNITYSGPTVDKVAIENGTIRITFKDAFRGLVVKGPLKSFAIAGEDQKFYWADGLIDGNQIILSSKNVPNPVAVRYAWANNPDANLYNTAGLPASPFKTDNWKDSTAQK